MTTVTTDEIRAAVEISAPLDRVWDAVSTGDGIAAWFCGRLQGSVDVGSVVTLDFSQHEGCGACEARIEAIEPKTRFAYKWHPGEDCAIDAYPEDELTLVEFLLEPNGEGTLLKVVESGFSKIPEARRADCFKANTSGWEYEIKELVEYVERR